MKKILQLALALTLLLITNFSIFCQHNNNIRYSQSGNKTQILLNTDNLKFDDVTINNELYKSLLYNSASKLLVKGAPEVLKFATALQIPEGKSIEINVANSEYFEINNINIAPSKGNILRDKNPNDIKYTFGEEYSRNEFFPGKLFQTNKPYTFRDVKGQSIWIYPFQYNPVTKTLRVYKQLTLDITYKSNKESKALVKRTKKSKPQVFENIYARNFINYSASRYSPVKEEGKMIVIAHPDFTAEMEDFVNWKNQKGQATELFAFNHAEINSDKNKLKTFIAQKYQDENIAFVLLVGDSQHIPPLYKSGDSDAAYGHIDGSDSYPEVIIGRFSAESKADVTTMVNRTIYYEKSLTTDDTWLNNGIGIASDEGAGGQGDDGESDIQHMTKIRNDLKTFGYTTVTDLFDPGVSSNNVTTSINQGCGVMNYVGHGSNTYWVTSGFGVNQIKNLTNENKCPFIFDVACVNGNFKGKTCFAEGFTRATKNGNPTGALAIIASTINQSWSPPMDGQDEMVDILVDSYNNNIKQTFGGVTINGCMHMNDQYGNGGASMTNTWTIFGDPSVVIRNKAPKQATINHDHEVLLGDDAKFTLTSDIDNILVALSRDNKIIATGLVNNGNVEFDLSSIKTEGDITITVTGQDIVTYISQIAANYVYNISLNITSSEDNNMIKDATINIDGKMYKTSGTDNTIIKLSKGSFKYSIEADGYVAQEGTINVVDKDIDVNIKMEELTYKVAFSVVSAEDNSNIKGANITFKENTIEYDGENNALFETKKGSFKYSIKADGYVSHEGTINVVDKDIETTIKLEELTYKVAFSVVSAENNSVIKGAEINFNGITIKHDGVNSSIFETKKGTFQLSVKANGYNDFIKNIDVTDEDIELIIQMTPIVTAIENNNLNKVTIFPNPATERFTVTTDKNADYFIINSIGCLIKTGKLTDGDNIIECNDIPSGIYFVRIKNQHNTTTRRVVIN